jgi:hypothetical protein
MIRTTAKTATGYWFGRRRRHLRGRQGQGARARHVQAAAEPGRPRRPRRERFLHGQPECPGRGHRAHAGRAQHRGSAPPALPGDAVQLRGQHQLAAINLWKRLGFSIVGTLPKAYRHRRLGYVDAYVMYRLLEDPSPLGPSPRTTDRRDHLETARLRLRTATPDDARSTCAGQRPGLHRAHRRPQGDPHAGRGAPRWPTGPMAMQEARGHSLYVVELKRMRHADRHVRLIKRDTLD